MLGRRDWRLCLSGTYLRFDMESDKMMRSKKFLGCSEDYMELREHLDVESYYAALKDPAEGTLWPFLIEVEVMAGELEKGEFFVVRKQSWFAGYVLTFEDVEKLNEYMRLRDRSENEYKNR